MQKAFVILCVVGWAWTGVVGAWLLLLRRRTKCADAESPRGPGAGPS